MYSVEVEREIDGRWIAEVVDLPGVLAYGQSREEAVRLAQALSLHVPAERIENGEALPDVESVLSSPFLKRSPARRVPRESVVNDVALPFGKFVRSSAHAMKYSQVDITEAFGDDQRLGPDDWIITAPLNASTTDPESMGLPRVGADADEVYRVACKLSELRESVVIPNDGVYCPVCHVANVDLTRLRMPCPRCGRPLLKFGWD